MKKNILFLVLGLIIAGSIGVYAAIKIQASEVEYNNTPLDKVLDNLYSRSHDEAIIEKLFKNSTSLDYSGIYPKSYPITESPWNISRTTIDHSFSTNGDFTISMNLVYKTSVNAMGILRIQFQNDDTDVFDYSLYDGSGVGGTNEMNHSVSLNSNSIYSQTITISPYDGEAKIERKNGIISYYFNDNLIGTIENNEPFEFNKINVAFSRVSYTDAPAMGIRNISIK